MARKALQWSQFRRLLLGTVVEVLLEAGVQLDFRSIRIAFHEESDFRVPRLDNYMRFKGELTADLHGALDPGTLSELERQMRRCWQDLLAVVDLPVGDRLTSEREHVAVACTPGAGGGAALRVAFDLEAD